MRDEKERFHDWWKTKFPWLPEDEAWEMWLVFRLYEDTSKEQGDKDDKGRNHVRPRR